MDIANLWAEIEQEHAWRTDELRFFQNQLTTFKSEDERKMYRKSLVLLLYAHFEGFCKFALSHYINAVNIERLPCSDVNFSLAAACLSTILKQLRNPTSKSKEFQNSLPDDAKLHLFAREREFIEKSVSFETKVALIPDDVIDTESNLKPVVLRKNLYKVGLPHDKFENFEGQIDKLLNFRNNIAHGSALPGIEGKVYEGLRNDVNQIMTQVKRDIMSALSSGTYRRV